MSEQNPSSNLPLFQQGVGVPPPQRPTIDVGGWGTVDGRIAPSGTRGILIHDSPPMTPTQHGQAGATKGILGAASAAKHLRQEAPAWLLQALGDALLACRDMPEGFSSDDVRRLAGPTVDAWLTAEKVRRNCFSGWMKSRAKLHKLVRVGTTPSKREDANGRHIAVWKFPA